MTASRTSQILSVRTLDALKPSPHVISDKMMGSCGQYFLGCVNSGKKGFFSDFLVALSDDPPNEPEDHVQITNNVAAGNIVCTLERLRSDF